MLATIKHQSKKYLIDLSKPLDISIAVSGLKKNVNAWATTPPKIFPVSQDNFNASVAMGASVNCNAIHFNPHAHGTHTECVGHITEQTHSINKYLPQFFFLTEVISVTPEVVNQKDKIISKKQLTNVLKYKTQQALVIRTLPNILDKKSIDYTDTNPPYISEAAAIYLRERGIEHLLIDLPSVDKEKDGGKLLAHRAFWNTATKPRLNATITELIYVDDKIADGIYFLNLMIAPFENDATPSKPVLYQII